MSTISSNQGPLLPLPRSGSTHSLYSQNTSHSDSPPKININQVHRPNLKQQSSKIPQIIVSNQGVINSKQTITVPIAQQREKSAPKLPQIKSSMTKAEQIQFKTGKNSFANDAAERYALFNDKLDNIQSSQSKSVRPHLFSMSQNRKDKPFLRHGNSENSEEQKQQNKFLGASRASRWMKSQSLAVSREQKTFKFMIRHFHKHSSIMVEALGRFWQIFEEAERYLCVSPYQLSLYDNLEVIKLKMESILERKINLQNFQTEKPAADWNQEQYINFYGNYRKIFIDDAQQVGQHRPYTLKKYKNCVFFGHMNNGRKEEGILHYFNGKCFEGKFKEDQKQYGLQIDDKQLYLGSFKKGLRHGEGILKTNEILSVGTFTYGEFTTVAQKKQQSGTSTIFDTHQNNSTKVGSQNKKGFQIAHSAITIFDRGSVVMKINSGDLFIGMLGQDGQKQGQGLEIFANGDIYIGKYESGSPEGYGEYYWENGSNYRGQFLSGMRHGRGVWQMVNGDSYEGEYMNDKKNGKGVYLWKNGSRYEGNFQNDYRHGYGQMKWQDGRTYKGKWLNGIQKNILITLEKPQAKSNPKASAIQRPSFRTIQHDNNKKRIPLDKLKSLYNPSYH